MFKHLVNTSIWFAAAMLVWVASTCGLAQAADPLTASHPDQQANEKSAWTSPIRFFQKVISRADGSRCPMYPSCSHYADQAFKRHGMLKGWILTSDRLLRCGRDESRISPSVPVNGNAHVYDPLEANTFWWDKR